MERRIRGRLNDQQPREQAGFQKTFSTTDHLQTVNQVIKKSNEYQINTHSLLIDFTKAFDTINQKYLLKSMTKQGVPKRTTDIIMDMYKNLKARILKDREGSHLSIRRGVRQGDPMSSILFNSLLGEIFRNLEWEEKGINISGQFLSNLCFADDIIL